MKRSIDARGLACPQPVIACRKAMMEPGLDEIAITVDNEPARENVLRFLKFTGSSPPRVASRGAVHTISAVVTPAMREKARGGDPAPACDDEESAQPQREPEKKLSGKTIFLSSDQVGRGDEALGRLLLRGFLHTIAELDRPPRTVVLMNQAILASQTRALCDEGTEFRTDSQDRFDRISRAFALAMRRMCSSSRK